MQVNGRRLSQVERALLLEIGAHGFAIVEHGRRMKPRTTFGVSRLTARNKLMRAGIVVVTEQTSTRSAHEYRHTSKIVLAPRFAKLFE